MKTSAPNSVSLTLVLALWFGLAAGFGEGLGLWLMQVFHVATWKMRQIPAPVQMVWAAPICYAILFGCAGLLLFGLERQLPRLPWTKIIVFLFSLGLFVALLSVAGRLSPLGILGLSAGFSSVFLRYYLKHETMVNAIWRRSLPWLASAILLTSLGIEGGVRIAERRALDALPPARPGAPNVLLLVVDTLRADKLSGYGYARQTSPHMDQVGREGVTFDAAVATSSWTLPTHASMFTGLAPHVHGAESNDLQHRSTMLAEAMHARGYRTAAVPANVIWVTRAHGFGPGFVRFDDGFYSVLDAWAHTLYGRNLTRVALKLRSRETLPKRTAPSVFSAGLDWIGKRQERPFFVFLNLMEVHEAYDPPPPWNNKFSNIKNPRVIHIYGAEGQAITLSPAELQGSRDAYDGAIAYVDDQIGRLLTELKDRGLEESTIVILTADHGESLGDHGLQGHTNALYWELVHVPLVMRWPGHLPAGKRVATAVSMASLPATILDLVDDGQQNVFAGPSLSPLWKAERSPSDWPAALAELAKHHYSFPSPAPSYHGAMKSLVNSQWHFILHEKFGAQLYDRVNDSLELHDQAATAEGQVVVAEFMKALLERGASFARVAQTPKTTPEPATP